MLTTALVITIVLLVPFSVSMAVNVHRLRSLKRQRGLFKPWPVRKVTLAELDPVFVPDELGPTTRTEVTFMGQGGWVVGGTTEYEAWILAVLAKRSTLLFEFGTCTGKTASLWARNLPPDGQVVTLTLAPENLAAYTASAGDDAVATDTAHRESRFTRFRYSGTDVEHKVVQLFGDSKQFDETPYLNACDVVFVDGSHAYSYVVSDSSKALRMVSPGGLVLWHDYRGPREVRDVYRALNELSRTLPLVHIADTTLVAYRRPAAAQSREAHRAAALPAR
jgi:predicted O-methyltransferase YrrM